MRALRLLFSVVMVLGGIAIALFIMAFGFVVFLLQRLFGRPAPAPRFQFRRAASPPPPARARPDDVIEIETTPVKE